MSLPDPSQWEVRDTRLGRACRGFCPHMARTREVMRDMGMDAEPPPHLADFLVAADEFIAACRAEGLL